MSRPRLIAFYLPQYYPTKENDEWWGKGFTEWSNVVKAKPLFKGHVQPKIPSDLGFYDLRLPETRIEQSKLAKDAGIEGFCYWHYWFAGHRLLDRVFNEVINSGSPDFPFCLCWANHSWYAKTWDPSMPDKLLIEQTYPGIDDYTNHFYQMLSAFKDERYIKVEGKLLFGIFAPADIPDVHIFIETWNNLAKENGLNGFHFFAYSQKYDPSKYQWSKSFDSFVIDQLSACCGQAGSFSDYWHKALRRFLHIPRVFQYDKYTKYFLSNFINQHNFYPSICPNFDHSPRSQHRGRIIVNSTPEKWGDFCKQIFDTVGNRPSQKNLVFIQAWNEWGEGNYLEPDLQFGCKYLQELKYSFNNCIK